MKKMAVVALGGNALLRGDQVGFIEEQESNTYQTAQCIAKLFSEFESVVITHGNGPQVGNILLRNEAGNKDFSIPKMPLDICVADSQGGIGYVIEQQMRNVLMEEKIDKNVVTLVTQVLIDNQDPAFANPTKPVGPYYTKEESEVLAEKHQWKFKEDPRGRGWRRVVASPRPQKIFNTELIKRLAEEGIVVIASGGGGIPVEVMPNGLFGGKEAVIDKDLAASLMARNIGAEELFILTDIHKVAINFRKPDEKYLDTITVDEALQYYNEGHFEAGSMGPKVKAAIEFVQSGGDKAIITDSNSLGKPGSGTIITK
ncbi:MAG: carbamate kinase [Ignavibacteria bacterium]|nr:carbamate kinase [Ignavibacteria bacterium]